MPTPIPDDEDQWIKSQRDHVIVYLQGQQLVHGGVGEYPAFHFSPYLALWAIQSNVTTGKIGWWAISGDLPTDYISRNGLRHPREALAEFARFWQEVSEYMLRGEPYPNYQIGKPDQWPLLGDLLSRRAGFIQKLADEDDHWLEDE